MSDKDDLNDSLADVLKCPSCLRVLTCRVLQLFDPHSNRTVQLFQCDSCRKHVWEDEVV